MPTCADTVLRLVRRLPLGTRTTPRALGVDDGAIKRGRTYGTILIDLESRRVVDLLPDRSATTLMRWLGRRGGHRVRVITRDRSTAYARAATAATAATAGAPGARQVADRWHLLLNARQMIERWRTGIHARLRRLPPVGTAAPPTPDEPDEPDEPDDPARARRHGAFRRTPAELTLRREHRARRRRGGAAPGDQSPAAARLHLARATVRKYASAADFPERAPHPVRASCLDPFLPHLVARQAAGCENALAL